MPEIRGLQIEARCIKCQRLPTAGIVLFELRNHLYLCNICRQQEEAQGKQIAWVDNARGATSFPAPFSPPMSAPLTKASTRTSSLPSDSIFALLALPLETPLASIKEAVKQQTRLSMREPDKKDLLLLLRDWQERLQDEEEFEKYRASLRPAPRERNQLSIGGRVVTSAQEFLEACEASAAGWEDGERYLRTGQLRHWIFFQLDDPKMALQAQQNQTWTSVSDFRALNAMLYALVAQRPFRFYREERWQPLRQVPSATTPEELACLCDANWRIAERHLYEGSLLYWLEYSRGIAGLYTYFGESIEGFRDKGPERGVGLELLLERALPTLPRPDLEVSFDGQVGACTIENWDREIPHRPVMVQITNTTRGYTMINMRLQQTRKATEPEWSALNALPDQRFWGSTEYGMPVRRELSLMNLLKLQRGRKYRREFVLYMHGEYGKDPVIQSYPITFKTMPFYRGVYGRLWLCGLRGSLPALFWNFVAGGALAFILFQLVLPLVLKNYLSWLPDAHSVVNPASLISAMLGGTARMYSRISGNILALGFGLLAGCVGFLVGNGRGHSNYPVKKNARSFRKGGFWLLMLTVLVLIANNPNWSNPDKLAGTALNLFEFSILLSSLMLGILSLLLVWLLAWLRSRLETFLFKYSQALLNPEGKA